MAEKRQCDGFQEISLNLSRRELIEAGLDEHSLEILMQLSTQQKEQNRIRQAKGIAAAKANGVRIGRPVAEIPSNFEQIAALWANRGLSLDAALGLCGVSSSTFFRWLKRYRQESQDVR